MRNIWPILEERLCNYRDSCLDIKRFLLLYKSRCDELVWSIVECSSFDGALIFFDELYEIQNKLAIIKYKYEYPLQEDMEAFIYHFERDDVYSRKFWYEKFKKGERW